MTKFIQNNTFKFVPSLHSGHVTSPICCLCLFCFFHYTGWKCFALEGDSSRLHFCIVFKSFLSLKDPSPTLHPPLHSPLPFSILLSPFPAFSHFCWEWALGKHKDVYSSLRALLFFPSYSVFTCAWVRLETPWGSDCLFLDFCRGFDNET